MKYHLIAHKQATGQVKDLSGYNLDRMVKYVLWLRNQGWLAELIEVKV